MHRRDEDPNATPAIAWVARRNQNRLTETNPLGQQGGRAPATRAAGSCACVCPGQANAQINITPTRGVHVGHDGAGNRVTATFYEGGALVNESYAYDGNNRLTSINRGGLTTRRPPENQ